jgi:ABC-type oligopeptide transport system substrate-binding subunit
VQTGRARTASGVVVAGRYRLVIRLVQPLGDFAERTTMPFFCAVPPNLPADPEGRGAFPGSGPYWVTEYRPGQRIEIRRNRHYRGTRPHHVNGFSVDLTSGSPQEVLNRIEDGRADWGIVPPPLFFDTDRALVRKYGLNRRGGRFHVRPGFTLRAFVLNTSRPLFRGNARLRRAVNFAIDRGGFGAGNLGARLTDQILPQSLPGFKDAEIYPLARPNPARARQLARGHLRGGKAVLYVSDNPLTLGIGQVLKRQLAPLGLDVEVRGIPGPAINARLAMPGEPFDMAFLVTPNVDYYDPYAFLNVLLESRFIGRTNWSHLRSAKWDRRLRAASRLSGSARLRAYGRLDVELARDVAAIAATAYIREPTLVSKRVGCLLLRPAIDLAAACLKNR